MQVLLHSSSQETSTGNGDIFTEPNLRPRTLLVNVSQISINLLGNITIKVQHSYDGSNWLDVPNLTTGGLTTTGLVSVALSASSDIADNMRVVWTFSNSNSITFTAVVVGAK